MTKKNIKYVLHVILILTVLLVLISIHSRGLTLNDEGYILHAAERIKEGELLFKDFFIAYTPLTPIITAFGLVIFGESIFAARIFALISSSISIFLVYKISEKITTNEFLRIIPVLVFLVWGPMHINFSWPVVYATTTGLASCYFLLNSKKASNKNYVLSGVFGGLTVLFKQNFGVAIFLACLIFFLIQRKNILSNLANYVLGFSIPLLLIAMYFLLLGIWPYAIENYYYYFYKKLIVEGNQSTPFFYIHSLQDIVKTIIYLSPGIISVVSLYFLVKKNIKQYLLIPLFTLFYYLLGIRPVTDYVHLVPLLAISGLPILLVSRFVKSNLAKYTCYITAVVLISLGMYMSLFKGYYRWGDPIITQNYQVNNSRVGVTIDKESGEIISEISTYVEANTTPHEYIFINYYVPTLYFITDRKNPTRFIYLSSHVIDDKYQYEIIDDLTKKRVVMIITSSLLRDEKTKITEFIRKRYVMKKTIDNFDFWMVRE